MSQTKNVQLDGPLTSALEDALKDAAKAPKKTLKAVKAIAKPLGNSPEAVAVFDAAAWALLQAHGETAPLRAWNTTDPTRLYISYSRLHSSANSAADALNNALKIELRLKSDARAVERMAQYQEFATRSCLSIKALTAFLRALVKQKTKDVSEDVAMLVFNAVRAGDHVTEKCAQAMNKLDPAIMGMVAEAAVSLEPNGRRAWEFTEPPVWDACKDTLVAWLAGSETGYVWATMFRGYTLRGTAWLEVLSQSGHVARIAAEAPPEVVLYYTRLLVEMLRNSGWVFGDALDWAQAHMGALAARLKDANLELEVKEESPQWYRNLDLARFHGTLGFDEIVAEVDKNKDATIVLGRFLNSQLLDVLVGIGMPMRLPDPAQKQAHTVWKHGRADDHPASQLSNLKGHPFFGLYHGSSAQTAFTKVVLKLHHKGTLGTFESWLPMLEKRVTPAIATQQDLVEAMLSLDVVCMLKHQFNAGLMDEWGWPALDEAHDRFGHDVDWRNSSTAAGMMVIWEKEPPRVVVVGPDGIVYDGEYPDPGEDNFVRALVPDKDGGLWVFDDATRHYTRVGDGERLDADGMRKRYLESVQPWNTHLWTDKEHLYLVPGQKGFDSRGFGRRGDARGEGLPYKFNLDEVTRKDGVEKFEPGRRKKLEVALPPWMAAQLGPGDALFSDTSFLRRAPGAGWSPLGSKDGLSGFCGILRANGDVEGIGIDGRIWSGWAGKHFPRALLTFPEREGVYPVIGSDLVVLMPDGHTPLVYDGEGLRIRAGAYWGGGPQIVPFDCWHHLRARDAAGSVALRDCTEETAHQIYEAAASAVATGADTGADPDQDMSYPDLQVIMSSPLRQIDGVKEYPALAEAVREALPGITHRRLLNGVLRMAVHAVGVADKLRRFQEKVQRASAGGKRSAVTTKSMQGLGDLLGFNVGLWWNTEQNQLGQQVVDADAFLFGDGAPVPAAEQPRMSTPADNKLPWFRVLSGMGDVLWRLAAPGTPDERRKELIEFLKLWQDTTFPDQTDKMRLVELQLEKPFPGMDNDHPCRLVEWDNRYFLTMRSPNEVQGIEVTHDGEFRVPPGAALIREEAVSPANNRKTIQTALKLFFENGPLPWSAALGDALASATGLMTPSAALLWTGAAKPWETAKDVRKLVKFKAPELALATTELTNFWPQPVYAKAYPVDPARLYAPLEKGVPDGSVVERLAEAWNQAFGKRPFVEISLVQMASEALRNKRLAPHLDLRVLEDPDHRQMMTRDEVWVMRPYKPFGNQRFQDFTKPSGWPKYAFMGEEDAYPNAEHAFSGFVLREFMRYIAWAHVEVPVGHSIHTGIVRFAELVDARLANPDLLLLAGTIDLVNATDATTETGVIEAHLARIRARFQGKPYQAADGGAAAQGVDCGHLVITWPDEDANGVFVGLRPAALETDADLQSLADDLAFLGMFPGGDFLLEAGSDVLHYLLWKSPDFQRLLGEFRVPATAAGKRCGDPQASAPAVFAETRLRHGLSNEAAAMFLQLNTLPSPDEKWLRAFHGWSKKKYGAISAELVASGLVTEQSYKGVKRKLFTAEVFFPAAPAVAMEVHKEAMYTPRLHGFPLVSREKAWAPMFGVALPTRPLAELFEAAS